MHCLCTCVLACDVRVSADVPVYIIYNTILALHFSLDVVFFMQQTHFSSVSRSVWDVDDPKFTVCTLAACSPSHSMSFPSTGMKTWQWMIEPHPLTPATGGPHCCNSPAGTRGAFSVQHEHLEPHSSPLRYLQLPGTQQLWENEGKLFLSEALPAPTNNNDAFCKKVLPVWSCQILVYSRSTRLVVWISVLMNCMEDYILWQLNIFSILDSTIFCGRLAWSTWTHFLPFLSILALELPF